MKQQISCSAEEIQQTEDAQHHLTIFVACFPVSQKSKNMSTSDPNLPNVLTEEPNGFTVLSGKYAHAKSRTNEQARNRSLMFSSVS